MRIASLLLTTLLYMCLYHPGIIGRVTLISNGFHYMCDDGIRLIVWLVSSHILHCFDFKHSTIKHKAFDYEY